nr:hypothetical protein [Tanacetum cinerariifolium]
MNKCSAINSWRYCGGKWETWDQKEEREIHLSAKDSPATRLPDVAMKAAADTAGISGPGRSRQFRDSIHPAAAGAAESGRFRRLHRPRRTPAGWGRCSARFRVAPARCLACTPGFRGVATPAGRPSGSSP